jgi:hypothetical protein
MSIALHYVEKKEKIEDGNVMKGIEDEEWAETEVRHRLIRY